MFELTYNMRTIDKYKTFEEAFAELYKRLKKDIEEGTSWQLLENAVWIKSDDLPLPTMFYEARDTACNIGLLVDGELNQEVLERAKNAS